MTQYLFISSILDQVPADALAMEDWLKVHHGIDRHYAVSLRDRKFLVSPMIATQPSILSIEDETLKARVFAISA